MSWTIYWFGVILAIYVGILHVIRIHNKVERMGYAVRNFTWIGYYYKTSVSWYGWRVPNPKISGTTIRKPKYYRTIIKNVFIGPWFSWIFIIKKIVTAIDELEYMSNMPDKLKEILNTIYEHDLPKKEMMKLVDEINKIGYHGYYFRPQDVRTEEEKKKEESGKVILKEGDTSIEISSSGSVYFKNYGSSSFIDTYNNTIDYRPDSKSYVFLNSTDEYKILDGNCVETRCIEFRDYNPESRREKNGFEYKPIENGIVYESRIVEDKTHELAGMKDKKLMKEYIEKEIDSYKRKAQWRKASWWISTAVLYANLDEKDFRKYIEIQLERAKCAVLHLEDLCEKYGFTLEFNKEGYYHIPELRNGKNKKKIEEFNEEFRKIIGDDQDICSKATIKMLEKYLKEDK